MNERHLIYTTIVTALCVSAGCATDLISSSNMRPSGMSADFVTQDQARHLAFIYGQRAAETSGLARHIELEASVFSRQFGPNHEESTRRLAEVKELLVAAEEADALARTYRRQVPHGQVQ